MRFDATRLTQLGRVSGIALSPDGSWLAVQVARLDRDDSKYVSELWRVPAAPGAGAPVQLTRGEHSDARPRFRRDGSLAFTSDRPREPGEKAPRRQVWILPAAGGEPRPLTDEPLGVHDFAFARAGDRLVVIADVLPGVAHDQQRARAQELAESGPSGLHFRASPVRFWDHWLGRAAPHAIAYDGDGKDRRDLTPAADREYRLSELDFHWDLSDDGARVALTTRRSGADRAPEVALHVIDTATGGRVELGTEPNATYTVPRFAPGGAQLAAARWLREGERCGRVTIQLFDLAAGGARRAVAADWDVWPTIHGWTADGRALLCTADLRGDCPLFLVDLAGEAPARITGAGSWSSLMSAPDSRSAFAVKSSLVHPPEPFQVALEPGAAPRKLGDLSGFSADEIAVEVESFDTPGDGGEPVQSFLVRPRGSARPPVVLWIHGGPIGQSADGWHWRWNPLVMASAGYAVLLPNPRGSTGRGQEFIEGVWNNRWGDACYRDLMAVVDAAARRADVDGTRMAAMGGSFGGYMTNWIGGQTDRFRCLVTHASVYHFSSFHGTTDEGAFFAVELGGTPYGDREAFERHSPHVNVSRWKSPTLILHGEKDYRCPVSEALLLFEALQVHGVEVELLVFPDENHWILRPRNTRQWYGTIEAFLARHLA
ncbi:MAG TPA: S9 family peptidase [Kofleriaceae bacterium]|nr:S9 family peptidase [Kofleriaceae bacterium]